MVWEEEGDERERRMDQSWELVGLAALVHTLYIPLPRPGSQTWVRFAPAIYLILVQVDSLWLLGRNVSLPKGDLQLLIFPHGLQCSLHCHVDISFGLGCL